MKVFRRVQRFVQEFAARNPEIYFGVPAVVAGVVVR